MNAKRLVNLTPHTLNVYNDENMVAFFAPSGRVARLAEQRESCPPIALGLTVLDVSRPTYGAAVTVEWDSTTQKPVPGSEQPWETPAADEIVVVSAIALDGLAKTGHDCSRVYAPGPAIRDDAGRQIGCHGLSAAPAAKAADPLAKLAAWVARRADWRLVITGTDTGVEVATRYPDGSDHCLGSGPTLAHAAAACLAELEPEARRAVPVIDGIIDAVHEGLSNCMLAGHAGCMTLPTRDEAARLLRAMSQVSHA